jgi:PmbA protein
MPEHHLNQPDQAELEVLVERALAEARRQGATQAEASVSFGGGISVTVRRGEVETLEHHRGRSLGVTVYAGQRKGSASSSDWSLAAIDEAVTAACDIARYSAEDPCVGLADPDRLATDIVDLDLYHPWRLSPEAAIEEATVCETAAFEVDRLISNSEGATVSALQTVSVYGNSHGFVGTVATTRHGRGCSVIAGRADEMQRGYWSDVSRAAGTLESPEVVGEKAAQRARAKLGGARLSTRTTPVLFKAEVARGLLGHFVSAVSGGSLYRRASFLLDAVGRQIFPPWFCLREEPHLPAALGSACFDQEGVSTHPRHLIKDGVLEGYVLGSYSARRLGMQTTGNAGGIHNLLPAHQTREFDALLKTMDTGLVVTNLMGQGVNLVTGDYSRGASGFWVEKGNLKHPVEEITIAGNLADMLSGIVAMGDDLDPRGSIRSGSILVEQMTVAGN